jgi:restriction endonuclease Mrr
MAAATVSSPKTSAHRLKALLIARRLGRITQDVSVQTVNHLVSSAWSRQICRRTRTSSFPSSTPCRRSVERPTPRRSRHGSSSSSPSTMMRSPSSTPTGRASRSCSTGWHGARSYDKLGGLVETPQRGLYVLSAEGKRILSIPDADARHLVDEIDRQIRRARSREKPKQARPEQTEPDQELDPEPLGSESEAEADSLDLKAALLARLHALTPRGFEDFVVHLLKSYGMELARTGGPNDEGVDAIGLAPISDVLSDRVAVQIKKIRPGRLSVEHRAQGRCPVA